MPLLDKVQPFLKSPLFIEGSVMSKNGVKKAGQLSEQKTIGTAHGPDAKPKLRLIDGYMCVNGSDGGGVYLDSENNVYVTEDGSQPERATIPAALRFMARRHSDGPDGFIDGHPEGMEEWFLLIANKLDAVPRAQIASKYWTKGDDEDTVPLAVNASASAFGMLSQAAVIHKCTAKEALELFVNHSDSMHGWSMGGFVAFPEYVEVEERKNGKR